MRPVTFLTICTSAEAITQTQAWQLSLNVGQRHLDIAAQQLMLMPPEQRETMARQLIGFTSEWRADSGGVLQFIDRDGHIAAGYVPKFNVLNLFRVPQKHGVSYVTPAAVKARLQHYRLVTGTESLTSALTLVSGRRNKISSTRTAAASLIGDGDDARAHQPDVALVMGVWANAARGFGRYSTRSIKKKAGPHDRPECRYRLFAIRTVAQLREVEPADRIVRVDVAVLIAPGLMNGGSSSVTLLTPTLSCTF